jgi:tRNA U34 5-methylaminomethyl-2-thiouridine-forming methyltransferase MnmC
VHLLRTADGSLTACNEKYHECYHSLDGAASQARELYLKASGVAADARPRVLELGFGLGVNFFVTMRHVCARGGRLRYLALEREPAPVEALEAVLAGFEGPARDGLLAGWGGNVSLRGECFELELLRADASDWQPPPEWATAIYYDPFSPGVNPDAWSPGIISAFYRATAPGGVLVTYSVAARVRRALAGSGFSVEKIPAAGRKKHWTRARKPR